MKARMIVVSAVTVIALAVLLGFAGRSSGSATAAASSSGVLRIGTVNYIDSLNPYNYIESQSLVGMQAIYPQLVQYTPKLKFEGDWASSWKVSNQGRDWTFKLRPNGSWSDGTPLTAADAAWTINTTVKYANGATAVAAAALAHVKSAKAINKTTLVIHYETAVGNVLPQLEQFYILPKHVWEAKAGSDGRGLKTYHPELHLPIVSAGPYTVEQYEKKGTTAFKADPKFYGPPSHAAGVALIYYTNSDAAIADLKSGNLDLVDQVPFQGVAAVKKFKNVVVDTIPGSEITNITWNSNPAKTKNRELLDSRVKKALSMCVNRDEIIDVVFAGYASKVESIVGHISSMENPRLGPTRYNCGAANAALTKLGYAKGSDGIRMAPATSGKNPQPAHPMAYEILTPSSLDFNVNRVFDIVKKGFARLGVRVTQKVGGDSTATYAIQTGDCSGPESKQYQGYDIALWDWIVAIDPDFQLSVLTKRQWCSWSDTGANNPTYDKLYLKQGTTVDVGKRRAIVYAMQKIVYDNFYYTQLVNELGISAHGKKWTGFYPQLGAYSKLYLTNPSER